MKPHKRISLLLLCLGFSQLAFGYAYQDAGQDETTLQEIRIPDDETLNRIANDPAYNYYEVIEEPSLWDRFQMWIKSLFRNSVDEDIVSFLIKWGSIAGFILVFFLLINQISKGELKNALLRRKNRTLLDLRKEKSSATGNEFEKLLNEAIQKKKFNTAVRYLYQLSLILLRDKELISLKADKTNHEYLTELGDHPASSLFERLTYFYEYADYGDFEIDETRFTLIGKVFNEFKASLKGAS